MYVYPWPPVGAVGSEWGLSAPVGRSVELFTGAIVEGASERRRRLATVVVEGAQGDSGGLMRALEQLLDGGLHAVRLWSPPANHMEDVGAEVGAGGRDATWRRTPAGSRVRWRRTLDATSEVGWKAGTYAAPQNGPLLALLASEHGLGRATASRVPPSRTLARPGQFVTVHSEGGVTSETRMLCRPMTSNSDGVAGVWTVKPFSAGGALQIGTRESGIFKVDGVPPRWTRGLEASFQVTWNFKEVFADEFGEVIEVNPWAAAEWA